MTTALVAAAAGVLLVAVALAALAALGVVPLVLTLDLAGRRGYGTARWGLAQVGLSLVGTGTAALALRQGSLVGAAVGALVAWAGPAAVALVPPGRLAGVRGRHEPG